MPRFSILTATKDRPHHLVNAIAAVQDQTFEDWELIICSAGHDPSSHIPHDRRIRHVRQSHGNLTDAMNELRALATGEILHVAEDDDLMVPYALEAVASAMKNSWLYGRMKTTHGEIRGEACDNLDDLLDANYVPCPTVYWTRDIGERAGPFDPECCYAWDYDYWLRLMLISPPQFLPKTLAIYGIHAGQLTNTVADRVPIHAAIAREKARRARAGIS